MNPHERPPAPRERRGGRWIRHRALATGFEDHPDWDRLLQGQGGETCAIGFVEVRATRP